MQTEALKLHIIEKIMKLENASSLKKIEYTIDELSNEQDDLISKLAKPMRKKIDIEELKREQNFQPIDKEKLFKDFASLEIEESIEELIEMSRE